ncbi:MAG: sigma-54-dependent Fis family transcriptional regulator [Ignavibacteriales bacterium]|nr:sigma-54-dependent Fis family transcriptional regulator [Ignavibacteriales bacterium]
MNREAFQKEHGIIGSSPEILEIVDVIRQVAPTDITVLITGESGVGKEIIARAIHAASKRSRKPLVTVNCGAIPEGLIESELFGHEKGSFTSAIDTRRGYFEMADGGTIFLDEIGEMPVATQVKLLRVLENGEFSRVGSSTPRTSDARVLAATNKNLEYEVQQKRFRPDLYFRLRSVNIWIPPLRNRRGDIPALVDTFVREFTERNAISFEGFSPEAQEALLEYHWPGNVRELRNVVESLIVLENGKQIGADDVRKHLYGADVVSRGSNRSRNLPVVANKTVEQAERELIYRALIDLKSDILELKDLVSQQSSQDSPSGPRDLDDRENGNDNYSLDEMERQMIQKALDRHEGNRRLAARELNISERTLYRKIKEYGLDV